VVVLARIVFAKHIFLSKETSVCVVVVLAYCVVLDATLDEKVVSALRTSHINEIVVHDFPNIVVCHFYHPISPN
jgi:hypothetical protein